MSKLEAPSSPHPGNSPGMRYASAAPWPNGDLTQVLKDEAGLPANLRGSATGCRIEVIVDHVAGTLSFGIDGAPPVMALDGFPEGAELRPWAQCLVPNDRVSFVRAYQ